MNRDKLERVAMMLKLLGHPLRLELVELLDLYGEKTVNELAELCGQCQPTVSLYLNKLKTLGLLGRRRSGHHTYYFLSDPHLPKLLSCLRGCACGRDDQLAGGLATDSQIFRRVSSS